MVPETGTYAQGSQNRNPGFPKPEPWVPNIGTLSTLKPSSGAGYEDPKNTLKNTLKTRSKERRDVLPTEQTALDELSRVTKYPYEEQTDLDLIRRLAGKYPSVNVYSVVSDWCISKLGKPLTAKENPRSQINTWCRKQAEWQAERVKKNGQAGRSSTQSDLDDLVLR